METARDTRSESGLNIELDELSKLIRLWIQTRRVGNITINFFKGGISSIKVEETLKLKSTITNGG